MANKMWGCYKLLGWRFCRNDGSIWSQLIIIYDKFLFRLVK